MFAALKWKKKKKKTRCIYMKLKKDIIQPNQHHCKIHNSFATEMMQICFCSSDYPVCLLDGMSGFLKWLK